jgi:hypothetical protein
VSGGAPGGDGGSGGSGGAVGHGGASGGGGAGVASGEIVWLEDGVSESVPTALADRAQQGIYDTLEITGAELVTTDARTIGMILGNSSPLGGTYMCSDAARENGHLGQVEERGQWTEQVLSPVLRPVVQTRPRNPADFTSQLDVAP